jgi:hypothetical protein
VTDVVRASTRTRPTPAALLVAGVVLVCAAFLSLVVLALTSLGGYDWPDGALVPRDGRPHVVALDPDRPAMLWSHDRYQAGDCTVTDSRGAAVPLTATDGEHRRPTGGEPPWTGAATFEPGSGPVEVTCAVPSVRPASSRSASEVAVGAAPALPPVLDGFGPWSVVPVALALSGLLCLAAAAVVLVRGGRRA